MPNTTAGGVRRLIFVTNNNTNLHNKYVPGAHVGYINPAARRALKRRATSSRGNMTTAGKNENRPCCPELQTKNV